MSYSEPFARITHYLGLVDFTGTPPSTVIRGPAGRTGRIIDIMVTPTIAFGSDTAVNVGDSTDPVLYATADIPATAIGEAFVATKDDDDFRGSEEILPADSLLEVSYSGPPTSPATGTGHVNIVIDWF